jgi:hypothetical protein
MTDESKPTARMNRVRIEWMRVLTPHEYVLLDKMLFQSNLTLANDGQGFLFHIRKLAEETGLSAGMASEIIQGWPFVTKQGTTKGMTIQLDYPAFETWIVHRMNNHCSSGEPISNSKNSTVPDGTVHPVNDKKSNENEPSEARIEPSEAQAIPVLNRAASTEGSNPIVHPVNNRKSTRFVATEPIPLPMPPKIKPGPSAARQGEIVRQINACGFHFAKHDAMGSERDGFKFCAVDDTEEIILITADDKNYLNNPKVHALCQHFEELEYRVMLWTAQEQSVFRIVREQVQEPVASYGSGNPNIYGNRRTDNVPVSVSAPAIQASASGNTNVGAPENNTGHSGSPADLTAGRAAG